MAKVNGNITAEFYANNSVATIEGGIFSNTSGTVIRNGRFEV